MAIKHYIIMTYSISRFIALFLVFMVNAVGCVGHLFSMLLTSRDAYLGRKLYFFYNLPKFAACDLRQKHYNDGLLKEKTV